MIRSNQKMDALLGLVLAVTLVALPVAILSYEHRISSQKAPPGARQFTLTGHAERGWILGEVHAYDAIALWQKHGQPIGRPVIEVHQGDQVVLKLTSSDVVHGFSLKDFGIFLTSGIQPGKTIYVSFTADKVGIFTFSCNAICGDSHQNMQGTLVVKA